ncbi:Hsp20/alpha crystallin family protein [Natrinema sp. CGMCC1.2065]|uniref:Hsp20/alpha crystallin family protein n=1 Tax=Natrinema sp. CGMCC1.2065 TaxID=3445767 RepID=UPI003F49C1F1
MTDSTPDDRDESADDSDYESDSWLSSLLSALESLEGDATSTSGRRRSDRAVFDYDISIRSGDDLAGDASPSERRSFGGWPGEGTAGRDRSRRRRVRSASPSSDHHVATREHEDELLVTADVAGVDPADVTVGFDDSTLVVAVDGTELDRVEVPWAERTAEAEMRNGVLTVHVRAQADDAATDDETAADDGTDGGGDT